MKSSLAHKIKAVQGSAGTALTGAGWSSPKGFTSLSMNGFRNMNPAEQHPSNTSQTFMTEPLG